MSLPAQHRLRHRRDFSKVYRHGNRYPSQHFVLRTLKAKPHKSKKGAVEELFPKQGSGDRHSPVLASKNPSNLAQLNCPIPTQVGISVSQKVSKSAVVRNRIKRQLKAAIRSLLPQLNHGWILVIVVYPSAIQCDYWQFLRELEQTLRMTEVLNGHS